MIVFIAGFVTQIKMRKDTAFLPIRFLSLQMKDILSVITAYREKRDWTEYPLAERFGASQSTIPHGIARTIVKVP